MLSIQKIHMKLLLVGTDKSLNTAALKKLKEFYIVDQVASTVDALLAVQSKFYAVAIIDFQIPSLASLDFCHVIRMSDKLLPIIVLTPKVDIAYKVSILDSGADDCLICPANPLEILARIRSVMRRAQLAVEANIIKVGDLSLHLDNRQLCLNDCIVSITRKEFDLLEMLFSKFPSPVSKELLLETVWERGIDMESNTLEVHIKTLRRKLGIYSYCIKTVYGWGYKLVCA